MKRTLGFAMLVMTMATSSRAHAFCRATTCSPKKADCALDEKGCVTIGAPLHFAKLPLVYRFSARGSALLVREEARAAIRAAFHRWSDAVCSDGRRTSLRFVEGEDLTDDKPLVAKSRGAQPFGIYFRDLGWPYDGVDETLAQTNHFFGGRSGLIEDADIEVNSGARRFSVSESSDGVDLQAVITHEVGHYMGLGHSIEPESIMASGYCELDAERCDKGKVAARRLAADDIAAVCTLFPPDGSAAQPAPPPADEEGPGCTSSPRSLGSPSSVVVACAAFAIVIARRRRR